MIDFSFYIKIQRSTFIFDECGVNTTSTPRYECLTTPIIKLFNGSILTTWDYASKVFENFDINFWESISNSHNSSFVKCKNLLLLFKSMYHKMLTFRLNDL